MKNACIGVIWIHQPEKRGLFRKAGILLPQLGSLSLCYHLSSRGHFVAITSKAPPPPHPKGALPNSFGRGGGETWGRAPPQVRPRPQKTLFFGKRWLHGGGGERGKTLPEKGSLTHRRERRGPPPFSVKERRSPVWVWGILLMEEESRAQRRRTEEALDPHRRRGKTRHRAKKRRRDRV